jgi:alpha-amylase/alpha-mannosidase (GH57 family)
MTEKKYICIHGHFYQPPRENPWLEEVELQDSARPYHDWNQRITSEAYAPNARSRIVDPQGQVIDIVNNYSRISFNFGPTLIKWIKKNRPDVYRDIQEADRASMEYFSGHGSAIAQAYNHIIMPLASGRDKYTQVLWGIRDFEYHFKRKPEGMWLPETAVDLETLAIMSDLGIKYTILAPHQAKKIRKIGQKEYTDGAADPGRNYRCMLPGDRSIDIFFYDGGIANEVAFGSILKNGENFARRLLSAFPDEQHEAARLVNIATDGETYGHHNRFGDMALAYCLYFIESKDLARIANYGLYLEEHPPEFEVVINENTSWSCQHGVERWRSDCGCNTGMHPGWHQKWRAPLRHAMDWLKGKADAVFEEKMAGHGQDPWQARNDYINVVLDRSRENIDDFFNNILQGTGGYDERVKLLKLLEIQRNSMLSFTSCGWFFDEISGLESVQVLRYAARCMQLIKEVSGWDLEEEFVAMLEKAPGNIARFRNGAEVYKKLVRTSIVDFRFVGANYAVSSLFKDHPRTASIYCFEITSKDIRKKEINSQKMASGIISIKSKITLEVAVLDFAVLHLGGYDIIGGVSYLKDEKDLKKMMSRIEESFVNNNISRITRLMDNYFGSHGYSLWHLFRDEQRKTIEDIARPITDEMYKTYKALYQKSYPVIKAMMRLDIPLPTDFINTADIIFNRGLAKLLSMEDMDMKSLREMVSEISLWPGVALERENLGFIAEKRFTRMMEEYSLSHTDMVLLERMNIFLDITADAGLELDLWEAQNIFFTIARKHLPRGQKKNGTEPSAWIEKFRSLGERLKISAW